ncbi:MAG: TonB-dependent receptor [Pseudomonadota bacterium]
MIKPRIAGLAAAIAAGLCQGLAPPAMAQSDQLALDEVVVTAERREATLQDVPVAVSAFDENEIQRRQTFNVVDIVNNVPNLVGNNNIGQGSATTVFLRGVGTTESIVTVDTAMGFYVDDVYIARQGVNNFSLYDIARVEVLRGPQGTLYGRNSSAGAIKVVTKAPSDEFEFGGEVSAGEFERVNLKGSLNLPLIEDTLAFRANVIGQTGDGYTDNVTLGRTVNDRDLWGWRGALSWTPTETLTALLTADRSRSDQAGLYASDVAGLVRPTTGDLFTVVSGTDTSNVGETDGMHLTVTADLSDTLQLQSITAVRNTYQRWNLDLTDQVVPIFNLYTINDSDQVSQELKLNAALFDDRVDLVGGVFYFDENSYSLIGDDINLSLPGGIRAPLPFFRRDYDVDVESWAAYAHATIHLSDRLSVVAGGRFTTDDKSLDIVQRIGGAPGFDDAGGAVGFNTATLQALGTPTELEFDEFTPKIGIQYDFNADVNGYLSYSQGFKSGGWSARTNDPNELVTFEPEFVNSYEAGLKITAFDGRARLNSVAFYYDYEDLFNTATGAGGNFIVATNDAEVKGVELEGTARISRSLDVFGFLAWQDGEYEGVDPALAGTAVGSELQRLPELSYKVGFTNVWDTAAGNIRLTADYSFTEDHFTNLQNTELARSTDIKLLNASLGWEKSDGSLGLSLSCRNCNDDEYLSQSLDFAGLGFVTVYPGEPRTWLVTLRAHTL